MRVSTHALAISSYVLARRKASMCLFPSWGLTKMYISTSLVSNAVLGFQGHGIIYFQQFLTFMMNSCPLLKAAMNFISIGILQKIAFYFSCSFNRVTPPLCKESDKNSVILSSPLVESLSSQNEFVPS